MIKVNVVGETEKDFQYYFHTRVMFDCFDECQEKCGAISECECVADVPDGIVVDSLVQGLMAIKKAVQNAAIR